jgi:orotidine-5'-phosphate decarboxylase
MEGLRQFVGMIVADCKFADIGKPMCKKVMNEASPEHSDAWQLVL